MDGVIALLVGFAAVLILGAIHHLSLSGINRIVRRLRHRQSALVMSAFSGLVALHFAEILLLALLNAALLDTHLFGQRTLTASWNWQDLVYLTGINFTTLGFAQIDLQGSIRLVTMLQSLGGFMLLTWSATFLYSACKQSWQDNE